MTGNRLIDYLLKLPHNTSLCELVELMDNKYDMVIDYLDESEPKQTENVYNRMMDFCAIIDYKCTEKKDLPKWIFDSKYNSDIALYRGRNLTDFDKFKMFAFAPQEFKDRNIYFKLDGLERI